jgi:AraC-like DNA-binding protein
VRTITRLAGGSEFSIEDTRVRSDHENWLPVEVHPGYRLIFVRRGSFRLRIGGWEGLVHPIFAYFVAPGDEQRIAHRPEMVDLCTSLTMSGRLLAELVGDRLPAAPQLMHISGRIDLLHRVLVSRARAGADSFELAERVAGLAAAALAGEDAPRTRPDGPARRLVDAARELITNDPASLGLAELAHRLCVSQPYLSRVFRQYAGVSLTRFRNQLRVRQVLDRIEAGEESLARMAAELGFADHAHLTRTVREEVGHPPVSVRRMLAPLGV